MHHQPSLVVSIRLLAALSLVAGLLLQCRGSSNPALTESVSIASVTVDEGAGSVELVLRRQAYSQGAVRLDYTTVGGTAVAMVDFLPHTGSVSWAAGDLADKLVILTLVDDAWIEPVEQFVLRVTAVDGAAVSSGDVTVSIVDNDQPLTMDWRNNHLIRSLDGDAVVAPIADVDGDGGDDLLIGEPRYRGSAGQVRVVSGRTGQTLTTVSGRQGEEFGRRVLGLGDISGDGAGDLLVASIDSVDFRWELRAYSGADGRELYRVRGDAVARFVLSDLQSAGDFNDDGFRDFLTGQNRGSVNQRSVVAIHSGRDGHELYRVVAPVDLPSFGASVAGGADLDGDGVEDFVVGAPSSSGIGSALAPAAYVYSGATRTLLHTLPGAVDSRYGWQVAMLGDVDGDGREDFAVSEPRATGIGGRVGAVHVYSGFDAARLHLFSGRVADSLFGVSLAGVGDLDLDGQADILIGASQEGAVSLFSGATGQVILRFAAGTSGLGTTVQRLGDLNADGYVDLGLGDGGGTKVVSTYKLPLATDISGLSVARAGQQNMSLDAGAAGAGHNYLIAGSLATTPGFQLGAVRVPLNVDVWFRVSLANINTSTFTSTLGVLDDQGKAMASLRTPRILLPIVGLTVYHAYIVFDSGNHYLMASNPVPLRFLR